RRREPNRLGQLLALFRGLRDRRLEALPADSYLFELVAQLRQLLLRPLGPLSVRGGAHAHPRQLVGRFLRSALEGLELAADLLEDFLPGPPLHLPLGPFAT